MYEFGGAYKRLSHNFLKHSFVLEIISFLCQPNAACKEKTVKLPNCGVLKFDLLQYKVIFGLLCLLHVGIS